MKWALRMLWRLLRGLFRWAIALVLLFEEWGWEPLARLLARLGRLPVFAWLERAITRLPPYAALAVFFLPTLLLLPVKLLALWLIGKGKAGMGLLVILGAKVLGTAVVARLFMLTRASLMRLAWFAHWYGRWMRWKEALLAQVRASAAWRSARRLKTAIKRLLRRSMRGLRSGA
jgi:hypothetical protein